MNRTAFVAMLLLILPGTTLAQQGEGQADLDRVAAEQKLTQRVEDFVEMGLEREMALFITLLEQSGMEPAEMLAFFMIAEHGGEGAGVMMLMDAVSDDAASQPVVLERTNGDIVIVQDGVLYTIGSDPLRVTEEVAYAEPAQTERDAVWSLVAPLMAEWGGEGEWPGGANAVACSTNLRQIGTAFGAYVDDHDGMLPGENWVEEITPHIDDRSVLRCPARPDLPVGYAMNAKMAGAQFDAIIEPGERILVFDTTLDAESPVGGPEAVPEGIVHEDGINVLFANGRVEWLEMPEVREVLGFPLGE